MVVQKRLVFGCSLVLPLALLLACRPRQAMTPGAPSVPSPAPRNACRGHDLDIERLPRTCEHELPARDTPPSDVLQVTLEAPPEGIASGENGSVWLRFRNASANLLTLQLEAMCGGRFPLKLLTLDGSRRVDLLEEVGGLGLCGTVPGVRVELEPGGVLSQRLAVSGRAERYAEVNNDGLLELVDAGPIPPGRYLLQVALPLSADHHRPWETRVEVATPLTIAPAQR